MTKTSKAKYRDRGDAIAFLTSIFYGTWLPPKSSGQRTYRMGKLIRQDQGMTHYGYGQLDSVILLALTHNKPVWMTRIEIAEEIGVSPCTLLRPLRNLAEKGAIKSKKAACYRGRPTHVYRLP